MATAPDYLEPGRIAAAISDLLIRNGYPPNQVNSWWDTWTCEALHGRSPLQMWLAGEYQTVWEALRSAYDISEQTAHRLGTDPDHLAFLDQRIAEIQKSYAS